MLSTVNIILNKTFPTFLVPISSLHANKSESEFENPLLCQRQLDCQQQERDLHGERRRRIRHIHLHRQWKQL